MRERYIISEPSVKTVKNHEKDENGNIIKTTIEKTFSNQSKKDLEIVIHKALVLQEVSVLPTIPDDEGRIIYELPNGVTALELLKELSELDIESEEWFSQKEFIVNSITDWMTCFYLALYLVFGQKWNLGKFDFEDFIFSDDGVVFYTDFEECITGYWEDEIAKICSGIMKDERIPKMVRTEIARSLRSKMISDLNLDKVKVNHQFLKSNTNRVR